MEKKKSSKEKQTITAEDVGSLDDILDFDDTPIEDPFVDDTASAIRPTAIIPSYRISGLSSEREREALKMLAEGAGINEVAEMFGVARSDISVENARK